MREPKPAWVASLRARCGAESDLRWNDALGRWEFLLLCGDGQVRSQFWGWFRDPNTGQPIPPDPVTGLVPFRDLDDAAMAEALDNLERSFVGNPHDGAGSPRREVRRRIRYNAEVMRRKYQEAGHLFADMAADRGHRLRGALLLHVPVTIGAGTPATPTPPAEGAV